MTAFLNRCAFSPGLIAATFFVGLAAEGYDEVARQSCYGLSMHVHIYLPDMIATTLAPANLHDTKAAEEYLQGVQGWVLDVTNFQIHRFHL